MAGIGYLLGLTEKKQDFEQIGCGEGGTCEIAGGCVLGRRYRW
jgi:hypothetical protein